MKERTYLVIVILLIIGLVVLGSISIWPTFWPAPNGENSNSTAVSFVNKTISDSSASIGYQIEASYPQFTGVPQLVNNALKNMVENQVNEFKDQISNADKTIPVTTGGEQVITSKVSLASPNSVSVWYQVMDAVPGMAHPSNYNLVYNYDINKSKELEISDLFIPGSNYAKTLSEFATKSLESQKELQGIEGLSYFVKQGAGPTPENFKLFNLTKNDLILIFNPGTVAPEFAGTRTVKIPLSDLKTILSSPPVTP